MTKGWIGVLVLLSLVGCNKIPAGTVTHMEHQPEIEWVALMPIFISNGKTTTTVFYPMYMHDDEDWAITIESCENDKCRHRRVYVTESEFNNLKEGDWYRTPEDYEEDRDVKRRATPEEQKQIA